MKELRPLALLLPLAFAALLATLPGVSRVLHAEGEIAGRLERAERLYREAQYSRAVAVYDSLIAQGIEDPRVYYNLGNARFKRGELALSRLAYERALRLDPSDGDTRRNLEILVARLTDRIESVPQFFAIAWWNRAKQAASPASIILIGAVFFVALLAAATAYTWWPVLWIRRLSFSAGAVLALLWILSLFLLFDRLEDDSSRRMAVVKANPVTMKSSPDRSGVDAFTVHEGLKVEIRDTFESWLQVRLPDGKVGWLPAAAIERI